jgi:hypothetical protein
MSVVNTSAATPCEPSPREIIEGFASIALAPAYFGPPAISILGPWLLLVLLLIGPAALLIVFVLAFVVLAVGLAAVAALLVSPYLLVRHLRAQHAPRRGFASPRRPVGAPPVAGERAPHSASHAPVAA